MTDAVTAADTPLNNPSQQDGPAVPNVDRAKAPIDVTTLTPEQIAAAAAAANAGKTPEQIAAEEAAANAPVDTPAIGEVADDRPAGPTSADADADGVITYEPTGDTGMDLALAFVGKLGLGMDDPAMQATANGDFSLIAAKLAAMGDKAAGWEQHLTLAKEAHAKHETAANERNTAIKMAITGVLGDTQGDVFAWAKENATDAERTEINAMLRGGPVQARAAAVILLNAYEAASGTTVKPASATDKAPGNGGSPPQAESRTLTNKQFAAESANLHRQYGSAYINTPEYRALSARLG